MLLLAVPASLLGLAGVLFLAVRLDRMRTRSTVRYVGRPWVSADVAESLIASELAPYLGARRAPGRSSSSPTGIAGTD